jgi:chromosome segregation ATPase
MLPDELTLPLSGGKSAVLSAITIALGGKANTTGRGNGLKSFVREGQQ